MNKATTVNKSRLLPDLMPKEAHKVHELLDRARELFEKWGYWPVIPSLHQHRAAHLFRRNIQKEILDVVDQNLKEVLYPMRFWYWGPVIREDKKNQKKVSEGYELGIELVQEEENISSIAEVISIAIELVRSLDIRDFRLILGNQALFLALSKSMENGGARRIAILRGDESVLEEATRISSDPSVKQRVEALKSLSRLVRELGYKGTIQYDLNPFLGEEAYASFIFRIESGFRAELVLWGGVRATSKFKMIGFSSDISQWVQIAEQIGSLTSSPKVDFLLVNRKQTKKSAIEMMRVLREHGYSVALDYSNYSTEELLEFAKRTGILNLMVIGDEEAAINEVRLIDVADQVSIKLLISDIFDEKSGLNKLLRYHKRLEIDA